MMKVIFHEDFYKVYTSDPAAESGISRRRRDTGSDTGLDRTMFRINSTSGSSRLRGFSLGLLLFQ